jgi:hypothetical protein
LGASAHQRKTESAQGVGQEFGIVYGIIQPRDIAVGRIADHERDALVRERGRRKNPRDQNA